MKMTPKRLILLRASQTGNARAARTDMKRSKRLYNFYVDFEAGNFNAQADDLENAGLIMVGKAMDGQSGPRHVYITAKGQEVLKNL